MHLMGDLLPAEQRCHRHSGMLWLLKWIGM
jgi:hypothetical protein